MTTEATIIPNIITTTTNVAPLNVSERLAQTTKRREANSGRLPLDQNQIAQLIGQGFTRGLAHSLNDMKRNFPIRFWIIDNSGSMKTDDGHRISTSNRESVDRISTNHCSRWDELTNCVRYHIKLAGLLEAPTKFRFLGKPPNDAPTEFSVAENLNNIDEDVKDALAVIDRVSPHGATPLKRHVEALRKEISEMAPQLRENGQRAVITIATDGLPSDTDQKGFVNSLRGLEGLPVWVVIRLCTDEEDVVEFYNDLDGQLELSIEVLDDFEGEAKEVTTENPWVNYTLPLHRLREFGYHDRVFDLLDERLLTKSEIRDYCNLLFHNKDRDDADSTIPDPSLDWKNFVQHVERQVQTEPSQWNPLLKTASPWIRTKIMNKAYKKSKFQSLRKKVTSIFVRQ